MKNLYVTLDPKSQSIKQAIDDILRRHHKFRKWCDSVDVAEELFELLFPNNMPIHGYVSNRLSDQNNPQFAQMALRVSAAGRNWPFPDQCTFIAIGSWPVNVPSPLFRISSFVETADLPLRPFEREFTACIVHDTLSLEPGQRRIQRVNNLLSNELLADLPPIRQQTSAALKQWNEFLRWKEQLIRQKACGLRYLHREFRGDQLVFYLIAESSQTLEKIRKALGREDLVAFSVEQSDDPWLFELPEKTERKLPRLGQAGKCTTPIALQKNKNDPIKDCPWSNPVTAELTVSLTEDDENELSNTEDLSTLCRHILKSIPESGFLSVSIAGDMSLIKRHQQSLRQLQEQGGYAPYLTEYLFETAQVSVPEHLEPVTHWSNDKLNQAQKEAVVKILSAPDLCLIQGPPGTGKTTVIAEAIVQLTRRGQRVLLASQAHTAVDNALDRLSLDSSLRVVRLARNERKVTEEGAAFTGHSSLQRYYQSLAVHAGSRLRAWKKNDEELRSLEDWTQRASFVLHDENVLNTKFDEVKSKLASVRERVKKAQDHYDVACREWDEEQGRLQRLRAIHTYFQGQSKKLEGNLNDIAEASKHLAELLTSCRQTGLVVKFSMNEWYSDATKRGELLSFMLETWKKFQSEREAIAADICRLRESKGGIIQDVGIRLRIEALQREVSLLEQKIDDSDFPVDSWRKKRQELRDLKQTCSTLEQTRYVELFSQANEWCAPGREASQLAQEIEQSKNALDALQQDIEEAILNLKHAVEAQLSDSLAEPPDDSSLRVVRSQERSVLNELNELEEQRHCHEKKVSDLLQREVIQQRIPLLNGAAATLAMCAEMVRQETKDLQQREIDEQSERQVWEGLLDAWKSDLTDVKAAEQNWEHQGTAFLASCNVVAITCNENERTLNDVGQTSFDVAIIDEVSKATPLELLMPLMRARRAVLVGDHRQLPPLFQEGDEARSFLDELEEVEGSLEPDTLLTRDNLHRFEKMVTASLFKLHFEMADDAIRARLNEQFRMHPQIMAMVNPFYEGQLKCGLTQPDDDPDPKLRRSHNLFLKNIAGGSPLLTPDDHVLWVDTTYNLQNQIHREDMDGKQPRRTNRLEAELIAETLEQIERQSSEQGFSKTNKRKVGVVSFYANQCREIRAAIRRRRPKESQGRFDCLDVEVNTVIRYQGKEKSIVLVSLVRHDGYDPLRSGNQPRRRSSKANVARFEFINVAFSRAQALLIVFGAKSMYASYEVDLPRMDSTGSVRRPVYKEILDRLERDARIVPARHLMSAEKLHKELPRPVIKEKMMTDRKMSPKNKKSANQEKRI